MLTAAEWALCRQYYASVFLGVCLCLAFVVTRVRDTSPAAVNKRSLVLGWRHRSLETMRGGDEGEGLLCTCRKAKCCYHHFLGLHGESEKDRRCDCTYSAFAMTPGGGRSRGGGGGDGACHKVSSHF